MLSHAFIIMWSSICLQCTVQDNRRRTKRVQGWHRAVNVLSACKTLQG